MLPIGRGVPPFVGHDTSRGVLPLVYVNRPASANDQTHPEESNSDDGWRGGRRAISIVTRLRRAHQHSPRPFTLPIIIEKERRNGGEIGFLHALCIPSAGGAVFYRACKQGTDRKVTYIQSLLLLIFPPPFVQFLGNRFEPPVSLLERRFGSMEKEKGAFLLIHLFLPCVHERFRIFG